MHEHVRGSAQPVDRRWLLAAFVLVLAFMAGEVVAGLLAHSLVLLSDAGHMVTDAAALLVAAIAAKIAQRPARGPYTYGFARVDALSAQANGITLILLAVWFAIEAVRHLIHPGGVHGTVVTVMALAGIVVNLVATALASRADRASRVDQDGRASLNVRGALAHLVTDVWAFTATFIAGLVILFSGWARADALATLIVGGLMAWTGWALVRAAGRVFLEGAPRDVDPAALGADLAAIDGVAEVHDLHIWQIGPGEPAVSAHVLVRTPHDCHEVSGRLRQLLAERYGVDHVTLQADHADSLRHRADDCADAHGQVHTSPAP